VSEYPISLFWSEEDGGWIADIPDLASCSAFGRTPQEALAEVLTAREAWLAAARAAGDPIPTPRGRPTASATG
jgi:predicted RNase H-like HicB family nuclease